MNAACSGCSPVLCKALDRHNLGAIEHDRERQAGVHPPAVEEHRAGAAGTLVAAFLRAGEIEPLPQYVEKRLARIDVEFRRSRVYGCATCWLLSVGSPAGGFATPGTSVMAVPSRRTSWRERPSGRWIGAPIGLIAKGLLPWSR